MKAALNEGKLSTNEDGSQRHIDKVKKILNPSVNPKDTLSSIKNIRVADTDDWVRSEETLKSWLNSEKKENLILLILEYSRSEKTYISENIIFFLKQQYSQDAQHASHTSICYFFFKDNKDSTRSFDQALNDLAYQISLNDLVYAKYLDSSLQSSSKINSLRSKWDRLFIDYFVKKKNIDSKTYVILDEVNEDIEKELKLFLQHLKILKKTVLSSE